MTEKERESNKKKQISYINNFNSQFIKNIWELSYYSDGQLANTNNGFEHQPEGNQTHYGQNCI